MSINVTSSKVKVYLSEFKSEVDSMNALFNDIDSKVKKVHSYWMGNDSDNIIPPFEAFTKSFENIKEQSKKYVSFINSVVLKYQEEDDVNKDSSSNGHLGINGS